jgi:hypothetical protein
MTDIVGRLIEVLLEYGNHKSNCRKADPLARFPQPIPCTCGWDEIKAVPIKKETKAEGA